MQTRKTDLIQRYIDEHLTQLLIKAHTAEEYSGAAEKVRASLSDLTTLSTPDFVLRRHIARTQPQIAGEKCPLSENLSWSPKICKSVARELYKRYKQIDENTWRKYLLGLSKPDTREKALRVAVLTGMGLENVQNLLIALEMNTLNMRYPLDFLCYPAFHSPGLLSWDQIQERLRIFLERHTSTESFPGKPVAGRTELLAVKIHDIIDNAGNIPKELEEFMDENANAFLRTNESIAAYTKSKEMAFLNLSKLLVLMYPYYIDKANGNSELSKGNFFLVETDADGIPSMAQLTKAMLHLDGWFQIRWNEEELTVADEQAYKDKDFVRRKISDLLKGKGGKKRPVLTEEEAECLRAPAFHAQAGEKERDAALYLAGKLMERGTIDEDFYEKLIDVIKRGKLPNRKQVDTDSLEKYLHRFQTNYVSHMKKVDQAILGKVDDYEFFTRNDALLFAYFFIQGYRNAPVTSGWYLDYRQEIFDAARYGMDNGQINTFRAGLLDKERKLTPIFEAIDYSDTLEQKIRSMLLGMQENKSFAVRILEVLDRWDAWCDMEENEQSEEMYTETLTALNLILDALGQRHIYILNRMDRLILLALLSDSPTELLPLIMSTRFKEDYDAVNALWKVQREEYLIESEC